jgi:bifunctional N-acetylglucosamine-1-phosphate-uridyltransferase/glucosamine-1-phosphate-acetyltransferase GlmU-like protein
LAHLNYAGDSLIGASVNLEAGAVLANHFNCPALGWDAPR